MEKLIKTIKAKLGNKSGLTMTSVMVAFTILLIVILMFQQAVNLSLNIFTRSEESRDATEELYSNFYRNTSYTQEAGTITGSGDGIGVNIFVFKSQNGTDDISISTNRGSYEYSGSRVYFFGNRVSNGGG